MLHDWPESYFKAQQSKGTGLAAIFKQAMGQQQAQKLTKTRSIMARLFPSSPLARLKSMRVRPLQCPAQWKRKRKKRNEEKRKEKTTAFGIDVARSLVVYQAAQRGGGSVHSMQHLDKQT